MRSFNKEMNEGDGESSEATLGGAWKERLRTQLNSMQLQQNPNVHYAQEENKQSTKRMFVLKHGVCVPVATTLGFA